VSLITFDGRTSFTTSETGRFEGELVSRTFTGPYTVNADCTGFLDFSSNLSNPPHVAHGNFVIVDEGKGFFVLDNEDAGPPAGSRENYRPAYPSRRPHRSVFHRDCFVAALLATTAPWLSLRAKRSNLAANGVQPTEIASSPRSSQ